MDGITTLKNLKRNGYNIPVIVLSSISKRGTDLTFECLESGAFDFIPKPSGAISLDIEKVGKEIKEKIQLAYNKKNFEGEKKLKCLFSISYITILYVLKYILLRAN